MKIAQEEAASGVFWERLYAKLNFPDGSDTAEQVPSVSALASPEFDFVLTTLTQVRFADNLPGSL